MWWLPCRFIVRVYLCLVLCFGTAWATMEGPVTIYQPVFTHDAGITVRPVIYTSRADIWATPGCMVARTLSENRIGVGDGFENRNAASLAGLRLMLVAHESPGEGRDRLHPGLFGDTLRVVLSAPVTPTAVTTNPSTGISYPIYPLADVLPATRDCLLLNAKYENRRFQYLSLRIDGAEGFAELEGVYSVPEQVKLQD